MSDGLPGDGLDTIRDPVPLPVPRSPVDARDIRIGELVVALSLLENFDGAPGPTEMDNGCICEFCRGFEESNNRMREWILSIVQPVLNGAKK